MNINRRNFFKVLLGIAATIVVSPKEAPATGEIPSPIPSSMDNLNVRRVIHQIQEQTNATLRSHLGEINDAVTRASIRNTVRHQLDQLKDKQLIHQYTVICNEQNNTPALIDKNQLRVDMMIHRKRTDNLITLEFIVAPNGAILLGQS